MARPVILFTNPWTDLPLEELVAHVAEWGYQGVELACWGDHFEVQRALGEDDYCRQKLDLLARHELNVVVLSNHRVGHAVADPIGPQHQAILSDYVWGDGDPVGVQQRAVEEMITTVRAAQKMGIGVISGFTGSPIWGAVAGYPPLTSAQLQSALREAAHQWQPILELCRECGIQFAAEIHPGQLAFDLTSAEMTLDAFERFEEFGFTLDPCHLHWQGVDPVEVIRRLRERIFHVHFRDVALQLNGRSGLLNGYLAPGDPRRGWEARSPGRGGVDWEALIRALIEINYGGSLSVDWSDPHVDRDFGAEEACQFVQRLQFEPAARLTEESPFRDE